MNEIPMHWLDLAAVAFIGAAGIAGARAGLVRQLIRLAVLFLSVSSAVTFCGSVAETLSRWAGEDVPRIAAAILTFVVVHIVLSLAMMIARLLLKGLGPDRADPDDGDPAGDLLKALRPRKGKVPTGLGWLNRLLGAALTMGIAALVLGGTMLLADCVPSPEVHAELEGSEFHRGSARTLAAILDAIPQKDKDELEAALKRYWQRTIEKTGEKTGDAVRGLTDRLNQLEKSEELRAEGKTEPRPGETEQVSK